MLTYTGKYTTANVMIDDIDVNCAAQIIQFINHPAFTNPVIIMSDTHLGEGCVIGFTMVMPDKIVPNTIGFDVNCGMLSIKFDHDVTYGDGRIHISNRGSMSRESLDELIRAIIPFGMEVRKSPAYNMERAFPWKQANRMNIRFVVEFQKRYGIRIEPTIYDYAWFEKKCKQIKMDVRRAACSIGTLGGGNHFIEFSVSAKTGDPWMTIHTGSRQLGKQVCQYWQRVPEANRKKVMDNQYKEGIKDIRKNYKGADIAEAIKSLRTTMKLDSPWPTSLDYLEGEDMHGYLADMIFASVYAEENRRVIADNILKLMHAESVATIETAHNFIDFEDFIIRKGAIAARKDQYVIIPFNMEDGILVCQGKGNPEWNYSAPHGAGRVLSRTRAKADCSAEVAAERMKEKDIYTSAIPVDEVKEAYKDPKIIEEAIGPTVEIIDRLRPILNMKEGK